MPKKIALTQGKFALVDNKDFKRVNQFKWYISGNGSRCYALRSLPRNGNKKPCISMHRFILDAPKNSEVDHRDNDGLNNTRANIRFCSRAQNLQNRQIIWGSSQYKGVSKLRGKWQATICLNKKLKYLGLFASEREAARTYNGVAKKCFGEFAFINKIKNERKKNGTGKL